MRIVPILTVEIMNSLIVKGMHCQNCVKAVKEALEALPGARGINVDLASGRVSWEAIDVSVEQIKEVIEDIGFDVVCV